MAAKRRKIVMEDFDFGTGQVAIPTDSGGQRQGTQIDPSAFLAALSGIRAFFAEGAPDDDDGSNGDFYFRSDGGTLTTIYQKRLGVWVGIV